VKTRIQILNAVALAIVIAILPSCNFLGQESTYSGGAAAASLDLSTVTVSATSVASGATLTITTTVLDADGAAVDQADLALGFVLNGGTSTGTFSDSTYVGAGVYQTTFTGMASGTASVVIATIDGQLLLSGLPSITVTPGSPSATYSTITGTGPVLANVAALSTVTITLKDDFQNAVPGVTPTFSATDTSSGNLYLACSATNASGASTCTFSSSRYEVKTLSILTPVAVTGGTVTFTQPTADLEVPIEMVDYTLSSSSASAILFERSRTSLNPGDYDGTISYYFEVIGQNTDSVTRSVALIDAFGTTVATVSFPSATTTSTRVRTTFSPSGSNNNFRLQLDRTTANDQLLVQTARMLVNQQNATKTRIYIPLLHRQASDIARTDSLTGVDTTTSTTYVTPTSDRFGYWTKNSSGWLNLASGTPWTLEAVLSTSNVAGTASIALYNRNSSTIVKASEATVTATTAPQLVSKSFADLATGFNDTAVFDVRIRSSSDSFTTYVARAGLWVNLNNIVRGEVYYRIDRQRGNLASTYFAQGRALLSSVNFSTPLFYFEGTGYNTSASESAYTLENHGSNEVGTAGTTNVTGSTVTFGTTKARVRSALFNITNDNRYIGRHIRTAGTSALTNANVVVSFVAD
jgi:hypothetical protein